MIGWLLFNQPGSDVADWSDRLKGQYSIRGLPSLARLHQFFLLSPPIISLQVFDLESPLFSLILWGSSRTEKAPCIQSHEFQYEFRVKVIRGVAIKGMEYSDVGKI